MNIKELWKEAGGTFETGNQHDWPHARIDSPSAFAALVAAATRARCIELVLAGSSMPVQTRTLEALQRDRKRIAKLIEEDGK